MAAATSTAKSTTKETAEEKWTKDLSQGIQQVRFNSHDPIKAEGLNLRMTVPRRKDDYIGYDVEMLTPDGSIAKILGFGELSGDFRRFTSTYFGLRNTNLTVLMESGEEHSYDASVDIFVVSSQRKCTNGRRRGHRKGQPKGGTHPGKGQSK